MTLSSTTYLALGGMAVAGVLVWNMANRDMTPMAGPSSANRGTQPRGSREQQGSRDQQDAEQQSQSTQEGTYTEATVKDLMSLQESSPDGFQAGTRAMMVEEQQSDYYVGRGSTGL